MSSISTIYFRNNLEESNHNIKCAIASTSGESIFTTNNESDYIYPRSSIKIFQAIPFVSSKAIQFFNLNPKQIALSSASHCAENYHVRELNNWLSKININKNYLKCGIHNPLDEKSYEILILSKKKSNQLHNNCAGKHLAMLSSCKINKYSFSDYTDINHPHQKQIRNIFSEFSENKIYKFQYGIDGCSAPQYAFKIKDLLNALNNILKSLNGKFNYKNEVTLLINSISKNPNYIGGIRNLDSNLIRITKGDIFCKEGAEGIFLFAHIKKSLFGIFKVVDGNKRALPSAVFEIFKKFKILSKNEQNEFLSYYNPNIYNHANLKVGEIKTKIN